MVLPCSKWIPPYVMDPANPYMNTLYDADLERIRKKARKALALFPGR